MKLLEEKERVNRKVLRWMDHPEQTNARILNLFMELSDNGKNGVFRDMLEDEFDTRYPERSEYFMGHFNQMKNHAGHNHCKVFDEDEENTVVLWYPVREDIRDIYSIYSLIFSMECKS